MSTSAHGSSVNVALMVMSPLTRCGLSATVHVSAALTLPWCFVPGPVFGVHSLVGSPPPSGSPELPPPPSNAPPPSTLPFPPLEELSHAATSATIETNDTRCKRIASPFDDPPSQP